jgi:hypothetical protein
MIEPYNCKTCKHSIYFHFDNGTDCLLNGCKCRQWIDENKK